MKIKTIPTNSVVKPLAKVHPSVTQRDAYSNLKSKQRLMILPSQKSRKDGLCMVYVELTIIQQTPTGTSYQPKRIPTEIRVAPAHWSTTKKEVKPSNPDFKGLNDKLERASNAVRDYAKSNIENAQYLKAIPKELETIERHFDQKHRKTLLDWLGEYINYRKSNSSRETWKEYRTLYGRLERFQTYANTVFYFESITFEWAEQLKAFARTIDLDPNTLKKTFDALTTFLNHYVDDQNKLGFHLSKDYTSKQKFKKVTGTHSSEPSPLYEDEFMKLIKFKPVKGMTYTAIEKGKAVKKNITLDAQERIKKLFLLSCFTGIRFSDILRLSKGNFQKDTIVIKASKTDRNASAKDLYIPILPPARDILEDIKYDISKIKLSNQKANIYLTAVLKEIGINETMIEYTYTLNGERTQEDKPKYEVVTFHSGRDTFITQCLILGIDITTVMSWSGHTKFETFKKYVRLSERYLKTQHVKASNFFNQLKKGVKPLSLAK